MIPTAYPKSEPTKIPTTSTPVTNPFSTPVTTPVSTPQLNYNYIGCYADNYPTSRAMPKFGGNFNSIQICYQFAKTNGYSFFGTQWNNGPGMGQFECWCTNDRKSAIGFEKEY